MPHWYPYSFVDGHVHEFVDVVVPSWKREVNEASPQNSLYDNRAILCVVLSVDRCKLTSAVAYMPPPSWEDTKIADPPSVLPSFPGVNEVELYAQGK